MFVMSQLSPLSITFKTSVFHPRCGTAAGIGKLTVLLLLSHQPASQRRCASVPARGRKIVMTDNCGESTLPAAERHVA